MDSINKAQYGARIYFLSHGGIFVRQTVWRKTGYRCDGWRGGIVRASNSQAAEVFRLIELAREGKLPHWRGVAESA
jgi:hypothetical protein